MTDLSPSSQISRYRFLLLATAGLGGLLYGIDVGIIAGALPYLEATSGMNAGQLSLIVAAVLLGGALSTLFAGILSDFFGRKPIMALSGVLFVISIPMIALADGFMPLLMGRLLQGVSAGLIGVVIPLYLAECLGAASRGKGTGIFQWLLTFGIVVAALIGLYFSSHIADVVKAAQQLTDEAVRNKTIWDAKDHAWRSIFWVSLPPGLLFVICSLMVAESPRWLFRKGRTDAARAALARSRTADETVIEMKEMADVIASEQLKTSSTGEKIRESLFQRRYMLPFVLACIILACNQLTGINSIIGYNATILIQAGLSDEQAHFGYVLLMTINFLMTIVAVTLVDRKGRKFLLSLGSGGVIVSLVCVALIFQRTEQHRVDCRDAVQAMVDTDKQQASVSFDQASADKLLASAGATGTAIAGKPSTLTVIYSYGDFQAATNVVRSDAIATKPLSITRESCLPTSGVEAFFKNPFADLTGAKTAPLHIDNAIITPVPDTTNGWLTALCIGMFIAFFAAGPGVCVWLALSELMPTRIRSNGMSIALLVNQAVSTTIAAVFLPTVGQYGYSTMFFTFAGCTVVYFITAAFFLPETKGRTLEEIESSFAGKK